MAVSFLDMTNIVFATDALFDGPRGAAGIVLSEIESVERAIEGMKALTLPGRRFQLQRDLYVEGARGCLVSARELRIALKRGDLSAAEPAWTWT